MRCLFTIGIFLFLPIQTVFAEETIHILYVYDGDTLQYKKKNKIYRLRLYGIDAPEKGKPYSKKSTLYLRKIVKNAQKTSKDFYIIPLDKDIYGRVVGVLYIKGEKKSFNEMLLEKGLARVYKGFCRKKNICAQYISLEKKAKRNNVGIWKKF